MKLQDEPYLLLTTLRRDGREVSTPMWAAWDGAGRAYMQTDGGSAKVKRIRSQAKVWLAPCNARGQTHGDRVTAEARIIESSAEAEEADRRLGKRYGWARKGINLLLWLTGRRQRIYLALDLLV